MKKRFLLIPVALVALATACKKDDDPKPQTTPPPTTTNPTDSTKKDDADSTDETTYTGATVTRSTSNNSTMSLELADGATLQGSIIRNVTLKAGRTYNLQGFVFVRNGATLKIEEGAVIKGDKNSKATLIITRNGKIDAQGTASNPVRFTSAEANPSRGDWGGIIILGNARTNGQYNGTAGVQAIEGGVNTVSEGYGLHGGTDDNDNSGTMKYVRIEYPGVAFATDNEINGLTMGSVGRGTTLDHIEVYKSNDDAFEWFGGSVNAKYLVAVASTDDDFDTDNGFSGKVQYGISVRDNQQADFATGGTSNGFESDNDATGTSSTPQTSAVFSNFTMIGPKAQSGNPVSQFGRGAHIRRNSAQSIFNTVFVGWNTGLRIDGSATATAFATGNAEFKNNFVVNASKTADSAGSISASIGINPAQFFTDNANTSAANVSDAMITAVALGSGFNPMPMSNSALLSGFAYTSAKLSGLEQPAFRGAVGTTAWYSGWTKFD